MKQIGFIGFILLPVLCYAFIKKSHLVQYKNIKPIITGSSEPFPIFDPLNLSDETKIQFLREVELQNGRLVMLSSSIISIYELITNELSFDNMLQLGLESRMVLSEFIYILKGWKNPYTNSFELKEDNQPGDFGFNIIKDFIHLNKLK
jgi:hypothetical protein